VKGMMNAAITLAGGCKWRRCVLIAHPLSTDSAIKVASEFRFTVARLKP
jgi:hypothetical protein